jgi:predicted dehydrogenase/threonine dehydrogenase-like Zn-dependent dehydrogenase
MKQILQHLGNGKTSLEMIPAPLIKKNHILIKTKISLISLGTEKLLIDFGKSNLINKARSQPDKVKQVIEKLKSDGFISTIDSISTKLSEQIPLGYCNLGEVIDTGCEEFKKGDIVISNGPHAEIVLVSKNLCAKVPSSVKDENAVFTVLGSVSLQGVRLANPTIGENFAVFGLGIIGLITCQILKANGCNVIAYESNKVRCDLAKEIGINSIQVNDEINIIKQADDFSNNKGLDGVIITASAKNDKIIHQSAQMLRRKGRIILVGVVDLNLSRDDFYEKEISFQVSSSYGPGRYDPIYESQAIDYPYGHVRWTVKRNFETILNLMEKGLINCSNYISNEIDINKYIDAYQKIYDPNSLGIILRYLEEEEVTNVISNDNKILSKRKVNEKVVVGFIGSGAHAYKVLLPVLADYKARLKSVSSEYGISGNRAFKKYLFENNATDNNFIYDDDEINSIFISSRHDTHADLVIKGLKKNKHIFVEKPLALSMDQLSEIEKAYKESRSILMVGFNRRYSKFSRKIRTLIESQSNSVASFIFNINAGFVSRDNWVQNSHIGGGRIVGEVCHYIDLMRYFCGSKIVSWKKEIMKSESSDTLSILLKFDNGSIGNINYFSNGHKSVPKENFDIYINGKIIKLNNFKSIKGYGWNKSINDFSIKVDKGHKNIVQNFISAISGETNDIISFDELIEISKISINLQND